MNAGVPSYEIIWSDPTDNLKNLIPEKEMEGVDVDKFWSSIEPQNLVDVAYPELVEAFKQSKIKPKKPSKRRKNADGVDGIDKMLKNTSISEPKPKRNRKKKENKQTENTNVKKIDSYFKQAVMNSIEKNNITPLKDDNFKCSTPKNKSTKNLFENTLSEILNLNESAFDGENDSDLSDIIDDILAQKLPKDFNLQNKIPPIESSLNRSSFFTKDVVENDLFERTFNEMCDKNEESGDSTEEYEVDENLLIENEQKTVESDDSFSICEIPLIDRIKNKM